ncbi:MAG TPA: hypothetical protein DCS67_09725 [Clostridiales bacterium UBA8960]|nr:hypothetical protein [Clostridiales bacterium UBA8960]
MLNKIHFKNSTLIWLLTIGWVLMATFMTGFVVVLVSVFIISIIVRLIGEEHNHLLASEEMHQHNYNELERYKRALEEEKDNYRKIMTASNEAYWQFSKESNEITIANFSKDVPKMTLSFSAFLEKVYFEDQVIVKKYFTEGPESNGSVLEFDARLLTHAPLELYHWFHWICIDEDGYLFGSITDINTEMINRERIEFYAFHDPVLGLYNMDYFNEIINNTMLSGLTDGQYALIVIGVVGYARILNAYGKNLTDIMSFQLSAEISAIFKEASYISTLHSGRFAIWIKCEDVTHCVSSAIEKLTGAIESQVGQFENVNMPIQVAYGGSLVDSTHKVSSAVIAEAEMAFEYAVENNILGEIKWFDNSLKDAKERMVMIEQMLLKAIASDELFVVYQPQYASFDGMEIIGYEALLRWQNESLGLVGPSEFIPFAESIDQVNQLGRFVIDEVTSFLSLKQKEGKTLKVSINASYKELLQNDYVSYLINRVEEKGLKRSQINIEITESTISEYLDVVSESLTALREHAFEIQMDDFGTGYSSLYQLGRLPIQVLKIDKIFILGLETDEKMFALTKLIIDIAHRLEIKIIAEGVETINQYQILKNMGCDYYQGYLFSKPKTADEVDAFSIRNSLGS